MEERKEGLRGKSTGNKVSILFHKNNFSPTQYDQVQMIQKNKNKNKKNSYLDRYMWKVYFQTISFKPPFTLSETQFLGRNEILCLDFWYLPFKNHKQVLEQK